MGANKKRLFNLASINVYIAVMHVCRVQVGAYCLIDVDYTMRDGHITSKNGKFKKGI